MQNLVQNLIVAAIVLTACWHVLRRYLPKPLKRRMANAVATWCRGRGWHDMAARMQPTEQVLVTGCDSCSACAGGKKREKIKRKIRPSRRFQWTA
jgi:hypothetical protein